MPFNTNAGYGIRSSLETVKELAPKSKFLDGFSTNGGVERDGILFVMQGQKVRQVKAGVKKLLQKIRLER